MALVKSIGYGKQYIDDIDINEVINVLKSDYLTQGPAIETFEKELAEYCEAKYCVVLNSGTSALHAAYFSLGLNTNDEFITSPLTFVATSNAGLYLGAKPAFVDIEPDTGNIDVCKIEEKINKNTKLITPVHYAGHPADLESIREIAKKNNLFIVEDASHALGSKYQNQRIGNCKFSDITTLSFHPVKHITTGEGGAILTNSKELYKRALSFRTHGIKKDDLINIPDGDWYYEMQELGYNYRMTDIQAALGSSQLKKLNGFLKNRRKIVSIYEKAFRDNPYFDIPVEKKYAESAFHLYPIRLKGHFIEKKREIFDGLRKNKLLVQVHYIPIYLHPYYEKLGYINGICPDAEDFYNREISLPLYPSLQNGEINQITDIVFSVLEGCK